MCFFAKALLIFDTLHPAKIEAGYPVFRLK